MSDAMIYDHPDFEPNPMNPSDMIHEIIDLSRACFEKRKAYVNIEITANGAVYVYMTTDISVEEYKLIDDFHIAPAAWSKLERLECRYDDAHYLQGIVLKLQAIVGGA